MNRILPIGGVLLLVTGVVFGSDQKTPKDTPSPTAAPAAAKVPGPPGGTPQAPLNKGSRLVDPSNPVTRLFRMTPEQRERALERANIKQRENAMKLLEWFDSLPKDQQNAQIRRAERFWQMTPEKQIEVKQLMAAVRDLPPPRQRIVRVELLRLQTMGDQQREATLHRPAFRARFSADELKIITGLADAWMGGPPE